MLQVVESNNQFKKQLKRIRFNQFKFQSYRTCSTVFNQKKPFEIRKAFFTSGLDGTRTRDPLRDRQVF